MTLSVEDVRPIVGAGASDSLVTMLLEAAYSEVRKTLGTTGDDYSSVDELITVTGPLLPLGQRAETISAVIEGGVELDSADYELRSSRRFLRRLPAGRRWRGQVDVTYVPEPDTEEVDRIVLALLRFDLNYSPGVTMETIGAWMEQKSQIPDAYLRERQAILASYSPGTAMMVR